jgi:integrase
MNELDPSHSPSANNVVLLRHQSQSPSLPLSEGIKENTPSFDETEVDDEPQQEPPRPQPKLALVPSVPTIHLDQELHVVLEQAMRALSADPFLFAKGDQLVRIITEGESPRLVALGSAQLREALSLRAKWMKEDQVHPPGYVATALVRRGAWSHIRDLRAMTTFPVLSGQGELRTAEGYDPSTRTLHLGGCAISVPERPTLKEAKAACARLLDLVADFPFVDSAHKSAWLPLNLIDKHKVDAFFAGLTEKELAPKSCKNIGGTLHKILVTAVEWEAIDKMPRLPKIRLTDPDWDWFTGEETSKLLEKARDAEQFALLLFPFDTGARAGEQLGLQWGDIDWHNRKVVFRRSVSEGVLGPTKTGKTRHVPLTPALAKALKAIKHLRSKHVFCNKDGSTLTLWQLQVRIEGACRRAGLRRIRCTTRVIASLRSSPVPACRFVRCRSTSGTPPSP